MFKISFESYDHVLLVHIFMLETTKSKWLVFLVVAIVKSRGRYRPSETFSKWKYFYFQKIQGYIFLQPVFLINEDLGEYFSNTILFYLIVKRQNNNQALGFEPFFGNSTRNGWSHQDWFHIVAWSLRCGAPSLLSPDSPKMQPIVFQTNRTHLWFTRLHIYGVDLRHLPTVASFINHMLNIHLDILINNAAQTIRRPPIYYRYLVEGDELIICLGDYNGIKGVKPTTPLLPSPRTLYNYIWTLSIYYRTLIAVTGLLYWFWNWNVLGLLDMIHNPPPRKVC